MLSQTLFPTLDPGGPLFLIAGPCALEDSDLNLRVASHLATLAQDLGIPTIFKASYDKANRTSVDSPRGPGIERGLELLHEVRASTGLPVLTDVHSTEQVERAADVVDVLQIPAFLSRQTDLLVAAGTSGLPVNVKKGQWMAPEQIAYSVEKIRSGGAKQVAVTERGTAFGYGRWVVDMRSFAVMRESSGCPALFDGTHAIQLPGGGGSASGGEPRFIEPMCLAAIAAGADGLYLEVHPTPESAPSDAATMLRLDRLESLLKRGLAVRHVAAAVERGV
jgi:2-dehydro-3-deoxyphosphooctonate aldolase (KDO 8-P synthase)